MMTQLEQNFFEAATRYFREHSVSDARHNERIIDWEQRRYEIAKGMLAAFLSNSNRVVSQGSPTSQARDAVEYADALIEELKK